MAISLVVAPSWAMAATYVAGAQSAGIVLNNAASNQRNGQTIATASTAVACAEIAVKGFERSQSFSEKPLSVQELTKLALLAKA